MKKIDILNSLKNTINENKHVEIDMKNLNKFKEKYKSTEFTMPYFDSPLCLTSMEDIIQYFFLIDSLNFKFWHDKDKSDYIYKGKIDSPALYSAIEDNLWLLDANRMAELNDFEVIDVFHNIPMISERKRIINDNGEVLIKKYLGKAINMLEEGNFEIPKILDLLSEIKSFKDIYKNHIFMKRAQLFLAMVHGHFKDKNLLKGIEELTVYADYQIPKLFEYLGIFKYSKKLKDKIDNLEFIDSESEEELSIRSQTINAGEILSNKLNYPAAYLDYLLWQLGRNVEKPHHYTRTIWY